MLLAACGRGGGAKPANEISPVQMQADAAVASSLIEAERTAIVAYGLAGEHLRGGARSVATRFGAQEREHARAIERALRALGGTPPPRRRRSEYVAGFPQVTSADSALRLALDIENTQVSAYADALGTVATPSLKATIASVLTTEAEHMSVILGRLREPQAPQAFVTGSRPT